jgi:hypothetical protein
MCERGWLDGQYIDLAASLRFAAAARKFQPTDLENVVHHAAAACCGHG